MNRNLATEADSKGLWAWAWYDWATQSYATVILTFVFAAYFTNRVAEDVEHGTTLWSLTVGLTGLCVALSGPFLGAIADRAGRRKPWIVTATILCIAATAALWFVKPQVEHQMLALILLAGATFGMQLAAIFYNAMLGDLAPPAIYGRWSGRGWAMGYIGGVFCLLTVLLLFVREGAWLPLPHDAAQHIRVAFPFVSLWLLVFSLPLLLRTPDRTSNALPWRRSIREGLAQVTRSARQIRRYRHLVRFLIARAIYSDGLATIFALGGVYAAGTFGMSETEVLIFGIGLSIAAGLGSLAFSVVDDKIGSRRTILLTLAALFCCSVLILLATTRLWFWLFGTLLGCFVGPVQSCSRSYLSRAAPEALRGQMFGVYALAGKSTSFLGPLIVGGLTALFQSQRIGMIIVPTYFALGWLILRGVPDRTEDVPPSS